MIDYRMNATEHEMTTETRMSEADKQAQFDAYDEGAQAAMLGADRSENPYGDSGMLAEAWEDGWLDEHAELTGEPAVPPLA
jgi:hypothetical protein